MKLNEWDYDGTWMPGKGQWWHNSVTYSVGIFRWVQGIRKLKRSPVRFRIKGYVCDVDRAIRAAKAVCERLNSGRPYIFPNTKSITVQKETDINNLIEKFNLPVDRPF